MTQTDPPPPPRSLTIGSQIASTTHVFLGLLYAAFAGLSSTLACHVFRVILLCEKDDDGSFAGRSSGDGEEGDGEIGMRLVRTDSAKGGMRMM
ncbi:hypothetical protein FIBSPDRAFT_955755 [Athelia psychrophila]|uniref:Uncharacterized protein n=1 Tax=Athelia psychrophila TaxID=1759441 RepID=A0A166HLS5_9AGAM|nr:hypothetical protein FIBSPDRAFT_955755 [Fibularhizoctonia sp. CBS 109695]